MSQRRSQRGAGSAVDSGSESALQPPSVWRPERGAELREELREAVQRANHSRTVHWFARAGLVATGLVNILIGVIAINVTVGVSGHPSQAGALAAVASTPGGYLLLWVAAVALFGLAFWQFTNAAWVTAPRRRTVVMRRLTDLGRAFGFAIIGVAALVFALGGHSDRAHSTERFSLLLVQTPIGIFILVIAGVTAGSLGVAHLIRGVTRRFREEVLPLQGTRRIVVLTLGLIGHVAKAVALIIVGALSVSAAVFRDPKHTGGLDSALKYLASLPFGDVLLTAVAVGFIAFGLYLFARARYMLH